ncbi:MAG: formate dehydrogenase accessory sulfurtransferase FdhD [Betaproteobacteria bacterium]
MKGVSKRRIHEYNQGEWREKEDSFLVEMALTLEVNGEEFVTMLCSPTDLEDLVLGFLFSEGLVDGADDLAEFALDERQGRARVRTRKPHDLAAKLYGKRTVTTGCGRGTIFYHVTDALKTRRVESDLRVSAEKILAALKGWGEKAELFAETGCPHSAALLTAAGELLCLAEDAGRHNALDKVIGRALREGWPRKDKCLVTTGRISSEMLIKTAKAGIPVVVSRSAATDLAVHLAEELGITAVGFARGRRMNVYTHPERILP